MLGIAFRWGFAISMSMKQTYRTLAIETSCDDTSLAIVSRDQDKFECVNIISYSQTVEHQQYGWVVPEIASRLHESKILAVLGELEEFFSYDEIDCISVTAQPGLPGSLLVGKTVAHMLATHYHKPLMFVNHIHGHIYSFLLDRSISDLQLPAIVLTVSGGHNDLYLVQHDHSTLPFPYQITHLWSTLDDAAGEAFDKVSRMLWWPYPGGPRVSAHASQWSANPLFLFKKILLPDQPLQFSFSGIKSNIYHLMTKKTQIWQTWTDQELCDICRAFEQTIGHTLAHKINNAAQQYMAKSVVFVWGVSANDTISAMIQRTLPTPLQLYRPSQKLYSTDNGAMIGVVGLMNWLNQNYSQ